MGTLQFDHFVKRGTTHYCADGTKWEITSPETAFRAAVEDAQSQLRPPYGASAYTGNTIAGKRSFILVVPSAPRSTRYTAVFARPADTDCDAINAGDDVTLLGDDKRGPALCIADADGWAFFGCASN